MIVLAAGYFLIFPVFLEIYTDPTADCQASSHCMAIFATSYDVMFLLFEMFLGGIILALYVRAVRRDSIETVEGF